MLLNPTAAIALPNPAIVRLYPEITPLSPAIIIHNAQFMWFKTSITVAEF
jgi:hypothetical protein